MIVKTKDGKISKYEDEITKENPLLKEMSNIRLDDIKSGVINLQEQIQVLTEKYEEEMKVQNQVICEINDYYKLIEDLRHELFDISVEINVSGSIFFSDFNTLLLYPNSLFSALIVDNKKHFLSYKSNESNIQTNLQYTNISKETLIQEDFPQIFINRDPEYFEYILEYMSTNTVDLSNKSIEFKRKLIKEADYYELDNLVKLIVHNIYPISQKVIFSDYYIYMNLKPSEIINLGLFSEANDKSPVFLKRNGYITINFKHDFLISGVLLKLHKDNTTLSGKLCNLNFQNNTLNPEFNNEGYFSTVIKKPIKSNMVQIKNNSANPLGISYLQLF